MKSFSSSVINKSGKKFAPKAPVRRAAPAPPPAASRRASVTSQASASHISARVTETATPEPPPPSTSVVEASVPSEPPIPKSRTAIADAPKSQSATAIPIPLPKRKASYITPIPRPTKEVPAPYRTSPSPSTVSTTEPVVQAPGGLSHDARPDGVAPDAILSEEGSASPSTVIRDAEVATEIRPSKRPRTSTETTSQQPPGDTAQLPTPPTSQISVVPPLENRSETRDESESQSASQQPGGTSKVKRRKSSRSTSNDDGRPKGRKPRSRKAREPTPEGAEMVEIAPSIVKMSELCKDLRTGKKSKRETELRNLELVELERKRAQQENETQEQTPIKQTPSAASPAGEGDQSAADKKSQAGPVMRIVNGEIVLDAASLQVDRHADAARNVGELEDVVENSLTRKINQATYGRRSKTESWDEDMTDLFYRGLRMFGTDFMLISKLFPGRSRRQIKLKFNNEERRDPQRIRETLMGPRESIDINTYSEMTNTIYDDPRVIEKELDDERKRIEEQYEKEKKAQEDLLRNPDGFANGNNNSAGHDKAPVKGKRNTKKQIAREMGGGTEEIIGTIDD